MGWKWMKCVPGYVLARARVRLCGRSGASKCGNAPFTILENRFKTPFSTTTALPFCSSMTSLAEAPKTLSELEAVVADLEKLSASATTDVGR